MKTRRIQPRPLRTPRVPARRRQAAGYIRRPQVFVDPEGLFAFVVLRPLSDLFLWLWRLERRTEFLYRPQFDRRCRPGLFSWAQAWQNSRRPDHAAHLTRKCASRKPAPIQS